MHILKCGTPGTLAFSSLVALALASSTALAQTVTGVGTPGRIPLFNGASSIGNSQLFQSGPLIGLGTTAPLDFMSIQFNNAGGTQTGLALQNSAAAGAYSGALMYDHTGAIGVFQGFNNSTKEYRINNVASGGTIHFLQGGISRFFVNNAGNVGIGTTTPGAKLEIGSIASGWSTAGWGRALELPNASVVKWRSNGTTRFGIGQTAQGLFFINANSDDTSASPSYPLSILNNGTVGIGTSTPSQAKLVISGSAGSYPLDLYREYSAVSGVSGQQNANGTPSNPSSLYATSFISSPLFVVFSDARIKRIDGRSDSVQDLATLAGIEVSDYTYRDTYGKGSGKEKKVVAQQVEQVFPQAVKRGTDALPDIYKPAEVKDGWVHLATDLKVGDRVRLIGKATEGTYEVLEVAEGKFRTDFKTGGDGVFVYGREVNDFRSVDYDAIAMLNVSATQELHRRLEKEVAVNAEQAARIADLEKRMAHLLAVMAKPVTHATFAPAPGQ